MLLSVRETYDSILTLEPFWLAFGTVFCFAGAERPGHCQGLRCAAAAVRAVAARWLRAGRTRAFLQEDGLTGRRFQRLARGERPLSLTTHSPANPGLPADDREPSFLLCPTTETPRKKQVERAVHGTYSDLRAPTVRDEVHPCSGEVVPGDGHCPVPAQPDVDQVAQLWSSLTSFCDLMRRDAHLTCANPCRLHAACTKAGRLLLSWS
jgi:hypothetical protein